ncbi:hypothetical protein BC827DRAFT_1152102 [Russula dissimulans]|nr:hypothetical protein BC827DRAFT_1152102 [Russula dissimulans]
MAKSSALEVNISGPWRTRSGAQMRFRLSFAFGTGKTSRIEKASTLLHPKWINPKSLILCRTALGCEMVRCGSARAMPQQGHRVKRGWHRTGARQVNVQVNFEASVGRENPPTTCEHNRAPDNDSVSAAGCAPTGRIKTHEMNDTAMVDCFGPHGYNKPVSPTLAIIPASVKSGARKREAAQRSLALEARKWNAWEE